MPTGVLKSQGGRVMLKSREVQPDELLPGQQLQCSWGYSTIESVMLTRDYYTVIVVCSDRNYAIKRSIGNWPSILDMETEMPTGVCLL